VIVVMVTNPANKLFDIMSLIQGSWRQQVPSKSFAPIRHITRRHEKS
jgi:hypothetical protein